MLCVGGWRFVCGCEGVGVLWGFLLCEGVRVFVCVLVLVWFGCVSLFALFAACVCSPFWVCSSVSVFVVFSCAVSCVLIK